MSIRLNSFKTIPRIHGARMQRDRGITEPSRPELLGVLRATGTATAAGEALGVSGVTVGNWMRRLGIAYDQIKASPTTKTARQMIRERREAQGGNSG